jgi:type 1 glutamine amidotransferase
MQNRLLGFMLIIGGICLAGTATAAESTANLTDCSEAHVAYSTNTLLIDLLLDSRANDVLQAIFPKLSTYFSTKTPTLAATMTPKSMAEYAPQLLDKIEALDKALAVIPITEEAAVARCARYDHTPPDLPTPQAHPSVLVFEKITGFRDEPSVNAARKALNEMAAKRGWSIAFTDNGAVFNAAQLKNYDTIVWNNISGDALTLSQRAAFEAYVQKGGGFTGIHGSGGDHIYLWDWYVNTLIGAQFIGHPMNPQFQAGTVEVNVSPSGITAGLPEQWNMTEEWYSFASNPRAKGARILATLSESSYKPEPKLLMHGEHPLAGRSALKMAAHFTQLSAIARNRIPSRIVRSCLSRVLHGAQVLEKRCVRLARRPSPGNRRNIIKR